MAQEKGARVLLLPGSRQRAYDDMKMLLDAVEILNKRRRAYLWQLLPLTGHRAIGGSGLGGGWLTMDEAL